MFEELKIIIFFRTNWRRIYKSLLLLDYLIKNGSERVVTSAREHVYDLRSLENYTHVDQNGKDQGINIRHKVSDMLEFVQDDDRLREERKKAKKNKDKYIGMSSDAMGFRSGYGGGGSGGWDEGGWKGFDKSGGGNNGGSGGTTGRWDNHSDDDNDVVEAKSDKNDFNDDSFGSEFDKARSTSSTNIPRRPSGGKNDFESFKSSNLSTQNNTPKKKPLKKVDLGAAATFGQSSVSQPQQQQQSNNKNNNIIDDLFSDSQPKAGQIVDSVDDFDPRGSSSTSNNATFDAFGADNNNISDAKADDGFADFSSAFSAGSSQQTAPVATRAPDDFDLFAAAPAMPKPAAAEQDLFADFSGAAPSQPAAAPAVDLFNGFNAAPVQTPASTFGLPAAAPAAAAFGDFGAFNTSAPQAPAPTNSNMDLLDGLSMASLPPSNMMQPLGGASLLAPQGPPSLPQTSALPANNSKPTAVGSTWSNMGALNDSLMNFSLSKGPATKTAAPSMNALKTTGPMGAPNGNNNLNIQSGGNLSGLDGLL